MNPNYLNEAEINAIVAFCTNKVQFDAVKKVVMHTITHQGVLKPGEAPEEANWVFGLTTTTIGGSPTNEQLGAELSAATKGLTYMQDGFRRLKDIRVEIPKKAKSNPAL